MHLELQAKCLGYGLPQRIASEHVAVSEAAATNPPGTAVAIVRSETMRTVLWTLGWIGVAVWTLVALFGFGLLGFVGDVARDVTGHVPGFPDETFSAPWLVQLLQSAGRFALFFVWLAGTALILAVPALLGLFFPRRERVAKRRLQQDTHALPLPAPGPPTGPMAPPRSSAGGRRMDGR